MRKRFDPILTLAATPIEDLVIKPNKRDKITSILLGLQFIYKTPELNEQIFTLLETQVIGDKKQTGRNGMDLWYILVLSTLRVGLDYGYDDIVHTANNDRIVRKILGIDDFFTGETPTEFKYRSIHENVSKLDYDTIYKINCIVCEYGEKLIKKKEKEELKLKADSYAFETNVHFPTDISLAWDAVRKCIDFALKLKGRLGIKGWRKHNEWFNKVKNQKLSLERSIYRLRGPHKEEAVKENTKKYIHLLLLLKSKVESLILDIYDLNQEDKNLEYFFEMLQLHIELIDRRLLKNEKIPSKDKIYSLFQPYTEWLSKGKPGKKVELGIKVLVVTDQYSLIRDFRVMEKTSDSKESILVADRLLSQFGEDRIGSLSFDRGFYSKENKELISLYYANLNMPKKGKKNKTEQLEESTPEFVETRKHHTMIESNINCLENHGINKCPDKSLVAFKRYTALGVIAYNLHKIGNEIKSQQKVLYNKTG